MKKTLLFLAAALMTVCSCQKDPAPKEDMISIDPESHAFDVKGGTVDVTVTSSEDWIMDGSSDWVTASTASGKSGDVVTFNAEPNTTTGELSATFTFIAGKKTVDFKLTLAPWNPVFKLASESKVQVICSEKIFEVVVESDLAQKDIKCEVSADASAWLKYYQVDKTETGFKYSFRASENEGDSRTGMISISADGFEPINVEVLQNAKSKIVLDKEKYEVGAEAGTVEITVTEANVEYEAVIPESCDWISVQGVKDNVITLAVTAAEESRECGIEVVAKDGTLSVPAKIVQVAGISGVKTTVVNEVNGAWKLYEEPWWPHAYNTYENAYQSWNPEDYGDVCRIFNKPTTESKVTGYVNEGFHIVIDMFDLKKIDGLRIRSHYIPERCATTFRLSVSNDNESWTELGTFGDGKNGVENWYFAFEGLECRYFKYEPLSIMEGSTMPAYIYNMMFYHL